MAVRREAVRLDLEDAFSAGMLRAAAAAGTLEGALDDLDGTSIRATRSTTGLERGIKGAGESAPPAARKTKQYTLEMALAAERANRLNRALRDQARAMLDAEEATGLVGSTTRRSGSSIDRLSGRLGILARAAAVVGPTLIPIGTVGVAAVAGLASQLGFAAVGMASLVVASQGVGDALTAVNKAALEPTGDNLRAAQEAMAAIGPDAQAFVARFQLLRPVLGDIRDAAAAGWFPGLTEALDSFESVAPKVAQIFGAIGTAGGNLVADAADALAGPEWGAFLSFVAAEAPAALDELGRSVGNVAAGMADLWMAFAPLNSDFSGWMLDASRSFADWADGLSETQGFQEFVDYIREMGPKVADLASSIGNALLQIGEAAAPLAGPVLEAFTAVADAIAAIADSPLGTPIMAAVTALSAAHLATKAWAGSLAALGFSAGTATAGVTGLTAAASRMGPAAAVLAGTFAVFGGDGLISDFDTWERGRAAVDATAGSLGELTSALTDSNVGKYAQELGIDVNRLAEDLYYNGEAGAYATEVMGLLDRQANGTGNTLESIASDILPGFRFESSKAHEANRDLGNVLENNNSLLGSGEQKFDQYGNAISGSTKTVIGASRWLLRMEQRIRNQRAAMNQAVQSFRTFDQTAGDSSVSLREWLRQIEKQGAALRAFARNAERAGERGLNQGLIRHLKTMGIEGALRLRQLANASEREIDRANKAWRQYTGAEDVASEIDGVKKRLKELGNTPANPTIDARTEPFNRKKNAVDQLIRGLTATTATPEVDAIDNASGTLRSILGGINALHDKTVTVTTVYRKVGNLLPGFADGGTIGAYAPGGTVAGPRQPYGDKVLTYLAPGEEVISNRYGQADRHRSLLKAINNSRGSERAMSASSLSVNVNSGDSTRELRALRREVACLRADVQAADIHNTTGQRRQSAEQRRGAARAARNQPRGGL